MLYQLQSVRLVLGLGLKAKLCGLGLSLGLAIDWPWPWDFGLGKNSRQTTKFTITFNRLEHGEWGEIYFKIHVPYLLTVGNHRLVTVL